MKPIMVPTVQGELTPELLAERAATRPPLLAALMHAQETGEAPPDRLLRYLAAIPPGALALTADGQRPLWTRANAPHPGGSRRARRAAQGKAARRVQRSEHASKVSAPDRVKAAAERALAIQRQTDERCERWPALDRALVRSLVRAGYLLVQEA